MNTSQTLAEWEERVALYGAERAVANVKCSPTQLASFIATQEACVLPLLKEQVGTDSYGVALDFGCGTGRWSKRLAKMTKGFCYAIDPTPSLLPLEDEKDVRYELYDGKILLAAHSVDVIFACLVLNAILDEHDLASVIEDMGRVLRPGGLVFVVDVTKRANQKTRWSVLRSEQDYIDAFASVAKLSVIGSYLDLGETHSVLAGRSAR